MIEHKDGTKCVKTLNVRTLTVLHGSRDEVLKQKLLFLLLLSIALLAVSRPVMIKIPMHTYKSETSPRPFKNGVKTRSPERYQNTPFFAHIFYSERCTCYSVRCLCKDSPLPQWHFPGLRLLFPLTQPSSEDPRTSQMITFFHLVICWPQPATMTRVLLIQGVIYFPASVDLLSGRECYDEETWSLTPTDSLVT